MTLDTRLIAKNYREINWKSKISLTKGLNMTIDWYVNNPKFITSISKKLYVKRLGLKL